MKRSKFMKLIQLFEAMTRKAPGIRVDKRRSLTLHAHFFRPSLYSCEDCKRGHSEGCDLLIGNCSAIFASLRQLFRFDSGGGC